MKNCAHIVQPRPIVQSIPTSEPCYLCTMTSCERGIKHLLGCGAALLAPSMVLAPPQTPQVCVVICSWRSPCVSSAGIFKSVSHSNAWTCSNMPNSWARAPGTWLHSPHFSFAGQFEFNPVCKGKCFIWLHDDVMWLRGGQSCSPCTLARWG